MSILVKTFVEEFKTKKIKNSTAMPNAVGDYVNKTLEIKTYLPFLTKRSIVNSLVSGNIEEVDGVKKVDSISQYISFVVAAITAHTNLEFDTTDIYGDYDLLAESGLLPYVIAEFKTSYDELDILLKMAIADEMATNNLNAIIGKFLNGVLYKLDGVVDAAKVFAEKANLSKILGEDFKKEDITKLIGFVDKLK